MTEPTRICPHCLGTVRESDCITEEFNVCPLRDPCSVAPRGPAWPFRHRSDDDGGGELADSPRPVAPAAA